MKISDIGPLILLAVLAVFIWLRDTNWISTADDTLPILISLPLFVWIGMPWRLKDKPGNINQSWIAISAILFLVGIALNLTILLASGWTLLLWTFLSPKIYPEDRADIKKLMLLPLMAFPWISLDATRLGWWFRVSGAWVTAKFYSLFGQDVELEGTFISINGLPISVEAACSGLNTLQSMLIAGVVVAFLTLKGSNRFWWSIPILFVMAWIANTIRIIALVATSLLVSPEFALGPFHTWGGWLILVFMFGACWLIFSRMSDDT